jgi:nitronate monooxygenase
MNAPTNASKLLQVDYPIIQAPMLGVTTPDMVAAIAHEGGLGSLPVGGLSPEKTLQLIKETKSKSSKSFSVNLFAHEITASVDTDELNRMQDFLEKVCLEYNLPFERKEIADFKFYSYEDQIDILINENIPIVSFTFGAMKSDVINRFKRQGTVLIGTATDVAEAKLLADSGVDAIVAQGIEAGGHRGSFLPDRPLPQVGLMSLLPQIADTVSIPVIAAGGLFDNRTIEAAFTLGAAAVQLGSIFIASEESAASEAYKEAVLHSDETSTELTRAFSGRWARGIRNAFMERMKTSELSIPYYTYQNSLVAPLRAYAQTHNLSDLIALWAGQSAFRSKRGTSGDIFRSLVQSLSL